MNRILLILAGILCAAVGVYSITMTVMAAIFLEYGRVIFYMTVAFISLPLAVISFMKLKSSQS